MTSKRQYSSSISKDRFLSQTSFDFAGKSVLVRIDCDVNLDEAEFRLAAMLPTIGFIHRQKPKKIILIGHKGRPGGQPEPELSLRPIANWFSEKFQDCNLVADYSLPITNYLSLLENLRFHSGETANDDEFAKELSSLADVYINDAFATSHRRHASLVGIPQHLASFLGLRMEGEIRTLSLVKKEAARPLVFVLGGAKTDKLNYLDFLAGWADKVLVGGKHPQKRSIVKSQRSNVICADLKSNGRDISRPAIKEFKQEIKKAKTVIWAGPMGVFEKDDNRRGTIEIAQAIVESNAFKLAGGGDTHNVISQLNIFNQFDFISTGGGAMLLFLKEENLPAISAVSQN